MSLNLDDLVVSSIVIAPEPSELYVDSEPLYTNTQPIPSAGTGCTSCWAVNQP